MIKKPKNSSGKSIMIRDKFDDPLDKLRKLMESKKRK